MCRQCIRHNRLISPYSLDLNTLNLPLEHMNTVHVTWDYIFTNGVPYSWHPAIIFRLIYLDGWQLMMDKGLNCAHAPTHFENL